MYPSALKRQRRGYGTTRSTVKIKSIPVRGPRQALQVVYRPPKVAAWFSKALMIERCVTRAASVYKFHRRTDDAEGGKNISD